MAIPDDGRSRPMSWVFGVLCGGVVLALLYLAAPMGPALVTYIGDTLRALWP